jgi:hypothetical protein
VSKKLIGIGAGAAVVAVAGTMAYRQYGGALKAAVAAPPVATSPSTSPPPAKVLKLGAEAEPPVAPGRIVIAPVTPKQMPPKASDAKPKAPATQPAATQPVAQPAPSAKPAAPSQGAKPQAADAKAAAKAQPAAPAATQTGAPRAAQPKKSKVIALEGTPQASGAQGGKLTDAERVSLSMVQQLHALRTGIELWQVRHGGQRVDFVAGPMWEQLTRRDGAGQVLGGVPVNPFNGQSRVLPVRDDPRPGQGVQGPFGYVFAVGSGRLYATDADGRIFDEKSVDAVALQVKAVREMSPADAQRSVLMQLGAMRSQVSLFTMQHNGTAPDFAAYPAFEQFLKPTTADGKVIEGRPAGKVAGPYIRSMPINPLNGRYKVKQVAGDVRPGQKVESNEAGWVYSTASARLYATDAGGCVLDDVKTNAAFIPADAGGTAKASGKPAEAVHVLRQKIELYRLQHDGKNPDLKKYPAWEQLTSKTKVDGTPDANGEYGPYLFQAPVNPANRSSDVEVVAKLTRAYRTKRPVGYVFESSTGQVYLTNEHGMLASAAE